MRVDQLLREQVERDSIAAQIGALLRSRPGSQTSLRVRVAWFQRKAGLFRQLAEHYGPIDPAEAAECCYLAAVATEQAVRLRAVQAPPVVSR